MAKVNLFLCDLGTRWTFLPAHRTCERYQAAPADVVEKRLAWLDSPTAKHAKGRGT
jgi:hypothetical protein